MPRKAPERPRSRRGLFAGMALVPGVVLVLAGCTTVIVPPASLRQPETVYLLDHGRHATLVLPHPDGLVRYAYGDWNWYAEIETGPAEALSALFCPTQAGLGRRVVPAPATEAGIREGLRVGIEALHPVEVEAEAVTALRDELEALYHAQRATALHNPEYGLTFVHHPEPYTLWHNSNHQIAQWMQRLGCEIRGGAYWSDWAVAAP